MFVPSVQFLFEEFSTGSLLQGTCYSLPGMFCRTSSVWDLKWHAPSSLWILSTKLSVHHRKPNNANF